VDQGPALEVASCIHDELLDLSLTTKFSLEALPNRGSLFSVVQSRMPWGFYIAHETSL